jgi:hypothetical protein
VPLILQFQTKPPKLAPYVLLFWIDHACCSFLIYSLGLYLYNIVTYYTGDSGNWFQFMVCLYNPTGDIQRLIPGLFLS